MKLYLAVLSVISLEWVVYPLSSIVLNVLLQHRVPVDQEPKGCIKNTLKSLKIL